VRRRANPGAAGPPPPPSLSLSFSSPAPHRPPSHSLEGPHGAMAAAEGEGPRGAMAAAARSTGVLAPPSSPGDRAAGTTSCCSSPDPQALGLSFPQRTVAIPACRRLPLGAAISLSLSLCVCVCVCVRACVRAARRVGGGRAPARTSCTTTTVQKRPVQQKQRQCRKGCGLNSIDGATEATSGHQSFAKRIAEGN